MSPKSTASVRLNGAPVTPGAVARRMSPRRRTKAPTGPWRGVVEHAIVESARVVTLDCGHRVLRRHDDHAILRTKLLRCEICGKAGDT